MVNGAEALLQLDGLNEAKHDEQRRDDDQNIRVMESGKSTDQRNDGAHQRDEQKSQRIEFSLKDKRF